MDYGKQDEKDLGMDLCLLDGGLRFDIYVRTGVQGNVVRFLADDYESRASCVRVTRVYTYRICGCVSVCRGVSACF